MTTNHEPFRIVETDALPPDTVIVGDFSEIRRAAHEQRPINPKAFVKLVDTTQQEHPMTTTRSTDRVQRLAEDMRRATARYPSMDGVVEFHAIGWIKSALADTHITDAKRVAEIRDIVAALDLANEQHRAELDAELAELRRAGQQEGSTR